MTAPRQFHNWQKSAHSGGQSQCVEVGQAPGLIGIRDTKNRTGGTLVIERGAFGIFLAAVKANRLH
ncbi:DUF397 domain-containing protein [Actinoalloteichus hymeniacidonis]|nr:DUF397 domain-containing protein [Actinoalloteichus hymeniacidonis]